jgi:alpha-tubulin suppressor-like RCC1 family protein
LTVSGKKGAPASASLSGATVSLVSAGEQYTCAVINGGAAKCWGSSIHGQLGDGSTTDSATPVDVSGLSSGVVAISAGAQHTCALTSGGGVKCWGLNSDGELGDGSTTDSSTPVDVSGLSSGVVAIGAGNDWSCALTSGGAVKCWGFNGGGRLGDGSTTSSSTPVDVSGLSSGVAAIAVGLSFNCALTSGGSVECWGENDFGQLGVGTVTGPQTCPPTAFPCSTVPVAVIGLPSAKAIAAGGNEACAVTSAGAAKCWGDSSFGGLGNGTQQSFSSTPVDVTGLSSGVMSIDVGDLHACAVTSGGAATCWGLNGNGQLGDGTNTGPEKCGVDPNKLIACSTVPVPVTGLSSGVDAISAGGFHTCAVTSGNVVECWGLNQFGQLGNGTTTSSTTPVPVTF